MLCPDLPYPANAGHRVDFWRRINAIKEIGASLFLVVRVPDNATPEDLRVAKEALLPLVDRLFFFSSCSGLRAIVSGVVKAFSGVPWHVSRRTPTAAVQQELLAEVLAWKADRILLEGPWCGELAKYLASAIGLPIFYRSHNIEHRYMLAQAKLASDYRSKLMLYFGCIRLKSYEFKLVEMAYRVLDISADDAEFWLGLGFSNITWSPPIINPKPLSGDRVNKSVDVLFLGNLSTPNNVSGVLWLVQEIWPLVKIAAPDASLVIAGSSPVDAIISCCANAEGVTLLRDVPDAAALYNQATALVNPIKVGSGVQIKAVEMLMTDAPIVSTSQGVRGLPSTVKACFNIANTVNEFSNAIVAARLLKNTNVDERRAACHYFTSAALANALFLDGDAIN